LEKVSYTALSIFNLVLSCPPTDLIPLMYLSVMSFFIHNVSVQHNKTKSRVCCQVAWLDVNSLPLTYDDRRVIDDTRFSVMRSHLNEWNLQVRQVRDDDAGRYRCTVNTFPVRSKVVYLHVKGITGSFVLCYRAGFQHSPSKNILM